jgi:hypothetical protein
VDILAFLEGKGRILAKLLRNFLPDLKSRLYTNYRTVFQLSESPNQFSTFYPTKIGWRRKRMADSKTIKTTI